MDKKWGNLDLNQGPAGYESAALTDWAIAPRGAQEYQAITLFATNFLAKILF